MLKLTGPLVNMFRLGWWAALGAYSSAELAGALAAHFSAGLAGCLGPHVSIELIGGFVLAKGIGSVLSYGVESCRGVFFFC